MTSMSVIPITHQGAVLIVCVIHGASLERIKEADPALIPLETLRPMLGGHACRHIHDATLLICYEENEEEFTAKALSFAGNTGGLLAWLKRGWKDRPGDGLPPFYIGAGGGPGGEVH